MDHHDRHSSAQSRTNYGGVQKSPLRITGKAKKLIRGLTNALEGGR